MSYKLEKAYEVSFSKVTYEEDVPLYNLGYNAPDIVVVRKILTNRNMSFFYYTKRIHEPCVQSVFNTINKHPLVVAGQRLPVHTACVSNITYNKSDAYLDGKEQTIWRVDVVIEIAHEKSLEFDNLPLRSFYFKNPSTNKVCRIQFSSTPGIYDKESYPNVYHAGGGYGFFSENRPDLNVVEPMFVTETGAIVQNLDEVVYKQIELHKDSDWLPLRLPTEIGDLG